MSRVHVFEIEDGGEYYWWSAETHEQAAELHRKHIAEGSRGESHAGTPTVLPDNRTLAIDGETYRAGDLALETKDKPVPLVGTTAV